jgi:hypothetical protein
MAMFMNESSVASRKQAHALSRDLLWTRGGRASHIVTWYLFAVLKFSGQMGDCGTVMLSEPAARFSSIASIQRQPCSHVTEVHNAFYPSSSRVDDTGRYGGVDAEVLVRILVSIRILFFANSQA